MFVSLFFSSSFFPRILFLFSFLTLCLALKAYLVQEERDRLRVEFIELEERVKFLSFFISLLLRFFHSPVIQSSHLASCNIPQ